MKRKALWIPLCACLSLLAAPARAELRLELEATSVVGNQELPRVVYIAAWRKSPKGDLLQQTLESRHTGDLPPIDRDVFRRQIEYHNLLNSEAASP